MKDVLEWYVNEVNDKRINAGSYFSVDWEEEGIFITIHYEDGKEPKDNSLMIDAYPTDAIWKDAVAGATNLAELYDISFVAEKNRGLNGLTTRPYVIDPEGQGDYPDVFTADTGSVEEYFFNPDAVSGAQIVRNVWDLEMIEFISVKGNRDFTDGLDSTAREYLYDPKDGAEYADALEKYINLSASRKATHHTRDEMYSDAFKQTIVSTTTLWKMENELSHAEKNLADAEYLLDLYTNKVHNNSVNVDSLKYNADRLRNEVDTLRSSLEDHKLKVATA